MLTWPWVLVSAALWLGPVIALIARLTGAAEFRLPPPLVTVALASLSLVTVVSAATSPFADASLVRTWPTLGGVALYFVLHDWLARGRSERPGVGRSVAALGTLVVGVSLLEWATIGDEPSLIIRNMFPFGHSNYTAGFIVLVFPWLVYAAWASRGPARAGWISAVLLSLFALATTSSRGGVLGLLVMGVAATVVILVRAPWSPGRKLALIAALAVVGLASVLANPRLRDLVQRRSWGDAAQESNRQRSAMLAAGKMLGGERPVFGWGPGTVPLAYPRVRAQVDGGVDNVLQLHNTPVQLWATLGSAGVAAGGLLLLGAAAAARRSLFHPVAWVSLASLGGYAVFALTDHQLDLPLITALAALDLAGLTAFAGVARSPDRLSRGRAALAALLLTGWPTLALLRDVNVRRIYGAALDELEAGRLPAAIAGLEHAARLAPHDPYFQHQAAGALLRQREKLTDPAARLAVTQDVATRLETSLRAGVHQEYAHFNLGWLYLELGNAAAAVRHFVAAAHLVPDKGGVYFGLGLALQGAGRPADALRAFALEGINDPRSITSPAWEVPALAALRPAVRAELLRLYAELVKTYPRAAVAEAWTRWWLGEPMEPTALAKGFTSDAADFVAALPQVRARQATTSSAKWTRLYQAWREQNYSLPGLPSNAAVQAALQRRLARHADDFLAFLRAGSEDEAALVRTYRRVRNGYGVLALHPEGPALPDEYIVQELAPVTDLAADLFPPKGWLPGRYLLALLPANATSSPPAAPKP